MDKRVFVKYILQNWQGVGGAGAQGLEISAGTKIKFKCWIWIKQNYVN